MARFRFTPAMQKRAASIFFSLAALGVALWLVLTALEENIVFYRTPAEINAAPPQLHIRLRLGGYVEPGSVAREGTQLNFILTDFQHTINVTYDGIAPDLFREGQGVIVEGAFDDNRLFVADLLLAKHDENYVPPLDARNYRP